jgi:hypothetical protein
MLWFSDIIGMSHVCCDITEARSLQNVVSFLTMGSQCNPCEICYEYSDTDAASSPYASVLSAIHYFTNFLPFVSVSEACNMFQLGV